MKKKEVQKITPFKLLELQLKLEEIEILWEEAKTSYTERGSVKDADEVLRLTVEKIKVLSELSYLTYEA